LQSPCRGGRHLSTLRHFTGRLRAGYLWLEDRPLVVVLVAAGATVAVTLGLASYSGIPHVWRIVQNRHNWWWLVGCAAGELVAYGGYVLTLRDMARVDDGNDVDLAASTKTVVAGFGVFAATRASGGFAVDYWAFREAGSTRRDAARRVVGLGLLEYVVLSLAALGASVLLYFRLDGHASEGVTLPSLVIVPALALGYWLSSSEQAERLSKRRSGFFRRLFSDTVAGSATVRELFMHPAKHGLGVLGNVLYWFGDIFCLWAALQVVGVQISGSLLVLAYSGAYILTRRALPAGGAGVVEVALTVALVGMGVRFTPALIGVLIYRLFNFWFPIVPALALMPAIRDLRARFQKAEQNAA
jgi:uncharacterized membrane protein YbhN (UPF0104 family)